MWGFTQKTIAGVLTATILTPFFLVTPITEVHAQTQAQIDQDAAEDARAGAEGQQLDNINNINSTPIGAGVGKTAGSITACLGVSSFFGTAASAIGLVVPVNDAAVTATTGGQLTKECVLDGITVLLREILIANITRSIVNWINGGFNGKPSFVQDFGKFLLNAADEVAGTFIEGSELAFLCSPFRFDVRIALAIDYYGQFRDRVACTLTGSIDNVGKAFNDVTSNQGWNTWFDLTTNPNNNAVGAFTSAQTGPYIGIQTAQGKKIKVLDWGDGFQPFQECTTELDEDGSEYSDCQTVTPGAVINNQLNNTISSGQRQIELADEIDEIIGALIGQLSKQVLGGSGGLAGLSKSSYSRPSYLDQSVAQSEQRTKEGLVNSGLGTADGAIANEQQYLNSKKISLQRLITSENALLSLQACYSAKLNNSSLSTNDRTIAQQRIATASTTIATNITPFKTTVSADITKSENNISTLVIISDHIKQASTLSRVQQVIAQELNPLLNNNAIHTVQDMLIAQQQRVDLGDLLTALDAQTTNNINECNNFPDDN